MLVTGGASVICSHLIDALVRKNARQIRIIDNLSSGRVENIQDHFDEERIQFCESEERVGEEFEHCLLNRKELKLKLRKLYLENNI